jgi:FkbH-like protein
MELRLADLPWLMPAPEDFRAQCRKVETSDHPTGADICRLANHQLDVNQLVRLAKTVELAKPRIERGAALVEFRVALISDTTVDFLVPALVASTARHGVLLDVVHPGYGQVAQAVLDRGSILWSAEIDAVLVARDLRQLGLDQSNVGAGRAHAKLESALAEARSIVKTINEEIGAPVMLQTIPPAPELWCGSYDRLAAASSRRLVDGYNDALAELAGSNGNVLFDVQNVAAIVGYDAWYQPAQWCAAKLAFALDLVPFYTEHAARLFAAMRGKTRKCLVLDLDDTLWGGVIGDDGLEGIRLGQGSAAGEAHLALQAYVLQCRGRGVIIATCSKNELDAALLPFRQHPEMLLKEDDIALFTANWEDKASNLAHIAKALNIGTDSLVFVDDNPAERERVRQMLPEVAVPELPEDPAYYVRVLGAAGYFEALTVSEEDAKRNDFYRANADRATAMNRMGDLTGYLSSLEMVCTVKPFDAVGRARIAQLVNKSNQYNVTTRRYTERQIAEIENDERRFAVQVRLQDKFGDNGMISVVIFDKGPEAWACDTWLMSCRVLGRRVEDVILAEVAEAARKAGAKRLIGYYIPSPKNAMVRDHFARIGFSPAGSSQDGGTAWELLLADYQAPQFPMQIVREQEPALA